MSEKVKEIKYTDENGETQYFNERVNLRERYNQNKVLLDLSKIPDIVKNRIIDKYENYSLPSPENIIKFFSYKEWPEYVDNIENVEKNLLKLY